MIAFRVKQTRNERIFVVVHVEIIFTNLCSSFAAMATHTYMYVYIAKAIAVEREMLASALYSLYEHFNCVTVMF